MKNTANKSGVVLFIVLATIFVVILLANIILNLVLNQSRFTHHQVSRIQAYYASQAGMNLALERLRTGNVTNFTLCNNSTNCPPPTYDPDIPYSVNVTIKPDDPVPGTYNITIRTNYTYTPPS